LKIRKKVLVYAGAAVYLFIVVMMGYVLFKQLDEKESVTNELTTTRTNLERLSSTNLENEKAEAETTLAQVTSEVDGLKAMMSLKIDNVPATELVFEVASKSGVSVILLSSPTATHEILEGIPCSITAINVTVEGEEDYLVEFITALNVALDTGVIQSVQMNLIETENQTPQAVVFMEVYNYQGG